jgi:metallo-beta-lactamase family protein
VRIYDSIYRRNAEVIVHNSFSAHADHNELLKYINRFDRHWLQRIFLVHGELERAMSLQSGLKGNGFEDVEIPVPGQRVEI